MTKTLIAISPTIDGEFLIFSPLIPGLVTQAHELSDWVAQLEDALGLMLDRFRYKEIPNFFRSLSNDYSREMSNGVDDLQTKSLIEVKYLGNERYLITSEVFPALVTEGNSVDDCLEQLKDALGLIIDSNKSIDKNTHVQY